MQHAAGRLAFILLLAASCELQAATKYHLTLEAHPAAPFPFLSRFGTVTLEIPAPLIPVGVDVTIGPEHDTQKQGFWVRVEAGRFKPLSDWLKSDP